MNVTVMSRWDAVFYCYNPHAEPTFLISIYDPHMQYAASLKAAQTRYKDLYPVIPYLL